MQIRDVARCNPRQLGIDLIRRSTEAKRAPSELCPLTCLLPTKIYLEAIFLHRIVSSIITHQAILPIELAYA